MIDQVLDGRYRIIQQLSSGGFAKTYLSEDIHRPNSPQCVVKQLRPLSQDSNTLENARRLFEREGEILERLGHQSPQIPQLFAYFEENSNFYLVEEFIQGHTLNQEIVPGQPLTEEQVIRLLEEVLEILVFIHSHRVIHRDIKPANLIRRESDGQLVLIDFGLVKEITSQIYTSEREPIPTIIVGTQGYMPIEQFHGYPQYNSDIYALGMMGIQAITGLAASELSKLLDPNNPNTGEVSWRTRNQVSHPLADIIDKMVRFDCRQRYQSAIEVLTDLRKLHNDSEINPTPQLLQPQRGRQFLLKGSATFVMVGGLTVAFYMGLPQTLRASYFYSQGLEKEKIKDYRAAIIDLNQAIRIKPNYGEAYNKRCQAHLMIGERQKAMEDCTKALQLKPNMAEADKAYANRGLARFQLGDLRGAIADYTQAIQINPNDAQAYNNRGYAREGLGDKQGAIDDFTQAIKVDAKSADAYLNRCLARSNISDHQGAIDDCTEAIKINPNLVQAYLNRSLAYYRLENYKRAIEDSNIAIRMNPVQINPDVAGAYYNRAIARFALGDRQGSIEDYTQAIRFNPNHGGAYYRRGLVHAEAGNRQSAIEDFEQAAKLRLEQGSTQGYRDAQYQLRRLQETPDSVTAANRPNR